MEQLAPLRTTTKLNWNKAAPFWDQQPQTTNKDQQTNYLLQTTWGATLIKPGAGLWPGPQTAIITHASSNKDATSSWREKKTKGKEMPKATCTGTSERKKKKEATKQSVSNKIVLRQHAPQRSIVVERVQPSNKVKSQTLRLWPLLTRQSSTDSSSMPHLSAELLILPLLTPQSPAPHDLHFWRHPTSASRSWLKGAISAWLRRFSFNPVRFVRLVHCAICNANVVLSLPIQFQAHTRFPFLNWFTTFSSNTKPQLQPLNLRRKRSIAYKATQARRTTQQLRWNNLLPSGQQQN